MIRSIATSVCLLFLVAGACAAGELGPTSPAPPKGVAVLEHADLPFARGETFATLDAYLAHLRKLGAQDVPFYREVKPGVYERIAGRGRGRGHEPQLFTRRELADKYGFSE